MSLVQAPTFHTIQSSSQSSLINNIYPNSVTQTNNNSLASLGNSMQQGHNNSFGHHQSNISINSNNYQQQQHNHRPVQQQQQQNSRYISNQNGSLQNPPQLPQLPQPTYPQQNQNLGAQTFQENQRLSQGVQHNGHLQHNQQILTPQHESFSRPGGYAGSPGFSGGQGALAGGPGAQFYQPQPYSPDSRSLPAFSSPHQANQGNQGNQLSKDIQRLNIQQSAHSSSPLARVRAVPPAPSPRAPPAPSPRVSRALDLSSSPPQYSNSATAVRPVPPTPSYPGPPPPYPSLPSSPSTIYPSSSVAPPYPSAGTPTYPSLPPPTSGAPPYPSLPPPSSGAPPYPSQPPPGQHMSLPSTQLSSHPEYRPVYNDAQANRQHSR